MLSLQIFMWKCALDKGKDRGIGSVFMCYVTVHERQENRVCVFVCYVTVHDNAISFVLYRVLKSAQFVDRI